jgi:hypothetical protein
LRQQERGAGGGRVFRRDIEEKLIGRLEHLLICDAKSLLIADFRLPVGS